MLILAKERETRRRGRGAGRVLEKPQAAKTIGRFASTRERVWVALEPDLENSSACIWYSATSPTWYRRRRIYTQPLYQTTGITISNRIFISSCIGEPHGKWNLPSSSLVLLQTQTQNIRFFLNRPYEICLSFCFWLHEQNMCYQMFTM